jgi:transposase InsO family protein
VAACEKQYAERSFQVVVSDVMELIHQGGKAYLRVHLDIFDKMIYGWQLSKNPDSLIVVQLFKMGIKKIKRLLGSCVSEIIFYRNRGSMYTSSEYIAAVLNEKCRLSYSRRTETGDNAVNESFFS